MGDDVHRARAAPGCGFLICFALVMTTHSPAKSDVLEDLYARAASEGELSLHAQGPPQVYSDLVAFLP